MTRRLRSTSRIRLPSGAMVAPGNIFTLRRYSPRFLMTISSLRKTSSTTTPTCLPPTFTSTRRKYPLIGCRRGSRKRLVEAHHFGQHVADFGDEFAADFFDVAGANAADFLDKASGNAKVCSPHCTNNACEMISVSGTLRVKREPIPFSVSISISPLRLVDVGAHHVETHPAPCQLRASRSGGEARTEHQVQQLRGGSGVRRLRRRAIRSRRPWPCTRSKSTPRPSSSTSM